MASEPKRAKTFPEENGEKEKNSDFAANFKIENFGSFKLTRVLNEVPDRRMIFLEGKFPQISEVEKAVVILDKIPFSKEKLPELMGSEEARLVKDFANDIYHKYLFYANPQHNAIKASVIFPATEKHITKYESHPLRLIVETPAVYRAVTRPFLLSERFTIDWVYNILEHKKEAEHIVFEDPHPETGFILLPDYKWNGRTIEDLYLIAIVRDKNVGSIRDLTAKHIPLLNNIWTKATKAIETKYKLDSSQLRAYFHYQPSYYHLHVHFSHISYDPPGIKVEKSHMLTSVIDNVGKFPNFYQQATLNFVVKEGEKIYKHYEQNGYSFCENNDEGREIEVEKFLSFFKLLGKAKHEPCGEHWEMSYGDSAWRMAIMCCCLPDKVDKTRLVKIALASALTSLGNSTDHSSEWQEKLDEVRRILFLTLPFKNAVEMYDLYETHVNIRRGNFKGSPSDYLTYRKLVEFEELMLQYEELKREGEAVNPNALLKKMCDVRFPGTFKYKTLGDPSTLETLLKFFLQTSVLCSLKRTGWVRSNVRDPERVAGHMFRMGMMGMVLDQDKQVDETLMISIFHDIAECLVGDITPKDKVTAEEKHKMEMGAMRDLVKDLPDNLAEQFYENFKRYEDNLESDAAAVLTKDLDKFDMILQAFEYEESAKRGKFLQEFFDSTKNIFKTEAVINLARALCQKRDNY